MGTITKIPANQAFCYKIHSLEYILVNKIHDNQYILDKIPSSTKFW